MSPLSTSGAPDLVKRNTRVYIKDGMRKLMTDSGYMHTPASMMRKMLGRMKGGRYGQLQDK